MAPNEDAGAAGFVRRLHWRKCWLETPNDYCAQSPAYCRAWGDDRRTVGRITLVTNMASNLNRWSWSMYAMGPMFKERTVTGYTDEIWQAAKAVEDAWFEAIKGTPLETDDVATVPTMNAYAAAKGR